VELAAFVEVLISVEAKKLRSETAVLWIQAWATMMAIYRRASSEVGIDVRGRGVQAQIVE